VILDRSSDTPVGVRYRSEAIRLDGFATAMKKDLKYMKDKLEVLGASTAMPLCPEV
jgi:hypothetical protein